MAPLLLLVAVVVGGAEALKMIGGVTDHTPKVSSGPPRSTPMKAFSLLGISGGVLLSSRMARAADPISVIASKQSTISIAKAVTEEESIVNSLISGASTRVAKELVLHPIDTVRARLQQAPDVNGEAMSQEGLFDNLYDGLLPALVGGVPAGALFFGVKDFSKKKLRKMGMGKQESTIISVMLTNVPYWVVRTPSEVLKTRRQIGYDNSSSVTEMMAKMVQEEGGILPAVQATYRSYSSNFAYALPADIVKFVAYEAITSSVLGVKEGAKIEGLQAAVTGAAASLIAQATTTPFDVARTRIMMRCNTDQNTQTSSNTISKEANTEIFLTPLENQNNNNDNNNNNNPVKEITNILESEGAGSLFSGLLPRAIRALASGGIQFASYELTQNALLSR